MCRSGNCARPTRCVVAAASGGPGVCAHARALQILTAQNWRFDDRVATLASTDVDGAFSGVCVGGAHGIGRKQRSSHAGGAPRPDVWAPIAMPKDPKRGVAMAKVKRRVANLTRDRIARRRLELEGAKGAARKQRSAAAAEEVHRRELIGVDIMFASIVLRLRMLRYYQVPDISPPARESAMLEEAKEKAAISSSARRTSAVVVTRSGHAVRPFVRQRRVTPNRGQWCP